MNRFLNYKSNHKNPMSNHKNSMHVKEDSKPGRFARIIMIILGSLCVFIGTLGLALPLLPTTPFLLLGAYFYMKSSDKFYNWLINNKYLGTFIKNYKEHKGMSLRPKITSITLLWMTILYAVYCWSDSIYISALLISIAVAVTVHLSILKTLK